MVLNESQYRMLCDACDRLLLAQDSTMERVAIPWLHVIRAHPFFLENYVDLFKPVIGLNTWIQNFRKRAGWYRPLFRSFGASHRSWFAPNGLPNQIDILFISHLLKTQQNGQKNDFYFGRLPDELASRGYTAMVALINHSGRNAKSRVDCWSKSSAPRLILSDTLRIKEESNLRRRLKIESFRLRKRAAAEYPGLSQNVLGRASNEAMSGRSLSILRMTSQIRGLVARFQPKTIILTHEGHAYERTAFAAARRARPGIRCIGYQHAAIFYRQHAILRKLAPEYNPDHVLTAGSVGKLQLEQAPDLQGIPISVLGHPRALTAPETLSKYPKLFDRTKLNNSPACLVLPEGIAAECHLLFEFTLQCAKLLPEVQFIWRLHPVLTYESLIKQNQKLKSLPKNIILSKESFDEDLERCCWALYRGTTAIVQAVMKGLRPIYLQLKDEMTIDPLYQMKCWRINLVHVSDFTKVLKNDLEGLAEGSDIDFKMARDYCVNFFSPMNPDVLESAIITKF